MRKNLKKLLIIILILGVIIAGVAAFFILNSEPDKLSETQKEEAVAQILGRKPNLNPDVKTGNITYEGERLSFSYPARAVEYEFQDPSRANNTSELESFSFDIENPRLIFNYIAVEKPDLTRLSDEPGVKLREDNARGYEGEEVEIQGIEGVSYKKDAGGGNRAEKSAFILNNGVLYTISITGASLRDVEELFEQIVNSAEFK
jgi:hypothetical protein